MRVHSRTSQIHVGKFRLLSILLAFTTAIGLVFGTAGFTTMDADRGVVVDAVEDNNAYLGYEPLVNGGENITAEQSTPVVEYRNQVSVDLDLEVDVSGQTVENFNGPDQLSPGNAGKVTVTLNCSTTRVVDLNFDVTSNGSGTSASFDRTLRVTCVPN